MNKLFALEVKGEIISLLKQNDLGYMDFIRICQEIKDSTGTNDIYTIKAINGKIVFLDTDWFEGLGELLSKKKQFITHNHSKNVYQHIGAVVR